MKDKTTYILLGFIAIVLLITTIITLIQTKTVEIVNSPNVPFIIPSPSVGQTYQIIRPEDQAIGKQQYLVGQLIDKLPYQGINFKLSYSFETNTFIVILNTQSSIKGSSEFDQFLKNNGILERSWINNLQINTGTL
jgi:hypothetical protein